jgi:hypothetical protein
MSMSRDKVYVGDARVRITLRTGIDLSTSPTLEIAFRRPDNTEGVWPAQIVDGDNQAIYVDTEPETLDQAGQWRLQARRRWNADEKQDGQAVGLMVSAQYA